MMVDAIYRSYRWQQKRASRQTVSRYVSDRLKSSGDDVNVKKVRVKGDMDNPSPSSI